jgi:glycosyltransferase involved in cell wall biosynthesis
MKVSIIIPVYNVGPYIKRCLESVTNQSYSGIECILVDDCGTDNSMEIVRSFIDSYNGAVEFVITRHEKNRGLSAARNTGIIKSQGDYLFFLDSDDAITPMCIEHLVLLANKYQTADFVQGNTVQGIGCVPNYCFAKDVPEFINNKQFLSQVIYTRANISSWNRLIKRSFIISNSLFFQEGIVHEDDCWAYFLAKYSNAAAFTNEGTYWYYLNSNSIMTSSSRSMIRKRLDSCYVISDIIIDDILKEGESNSYQRIHLAHILENIPKLLLHRSALFWFYYWKYLCRKAICLCRFVTLYRLLFLFAMLPPLCFLLKWKTWNWRLNHYIISKV